MSAQCIEGETHKIKMQTYNSSMLLLFPTPDSNYVDLVTTKVESLASTV